MKKAVLYARVSSDLQKKEKTIESQIVELRRQVVADGNVLVKEYVDEGFSGAMLDRPAMNQLRNDIKTGLFDTIYFLNTDRIAREVTYQTIIIAEILKQQKQIIINGKDYIHNPENKFSLTVLGAVAELERAKIIERVTRGKQQRIAQGGLSANGCYVYGYDHHRRTPTSPPAYTVNETEAAIVRHVFESYAKDGVSMGNIIKDLERNNAPTKKGKGIWRKSLIKAMFNNEMYIGTRYYNMMRKVSEHANPIHGIRHSSSKLIRRDRKDWVGVPVPPIIPKELFDKVHARLDWNKKHYRNPKIIQLLSSMVRCGCCGSAMFAYRRYYIDKRGKDPKPHLRTAYKCTFRYNLCGHDIAFRRRMGSCDSMEIKSATIETHIFMMIETMLTSPEKVRLSMDFFKRRTQTNQARQQRQLDETEEGIRRNAESRARILDLYTSGQIDKNTYIKKCVLCDEEFNLLKLKKMELLKQIPLIHRKEVVETSVEQYCESARIRLQKCTDFDTKRQFLLDYVKKIVYWNDRLEIHGTIPVELKAQRDGKQETEIVRLEFQIKDPILRAERFSRRKSPAGSFVPINSEKYDDLFKQNTLD